MADDADRADEQDYPDCRICGHHVAVHRHLLDDVLECKVSGCTCTAFEPVWDSADPALRAELAEERRRREQADCNWEAACEETEIARSWARFLHDHLAEQGSGVVPEGLPGWIYDRIGYDGLDRHIVERAMLRQALADLLDATGTPITQEWHEAARRARQVLGRGGS
jgi:hypothetical protein